MKHNNNIFDDLGLGRGFGISENHGGTGGGGEERVCPIVKTINNISGRYEGGADSSSHMSRVIGGRVFVFDDANLFCDQFAMGVARLELRRPPIEKLKIHYRNMVEPIRAIGTDEGLIEYILERTNVLTLAREKNSDIHDAINTLHERIMVAAYAAARQGKCLNMIIPACPMLGTKAIGESIDAAGQYLAALDISCVSRSAKYVHAAPHSNNDSNSGAKEYKISREVTLETFKECSEVLERVRSIAAKREAALIEQAAAADSILNFIATIRFIY